MTSTNVSDNNIKVKWFNQYLGTFIASLGGFSVGVSLAWNSSAGEKFRDDLDASGTEIGLVGSVLNVGACLGLILVSFVVRRVRLTFVMLFMLPLFVIGWAFICFAHDQIVLFAIGRLICGVPCGVLSVLTPIYVAEIAEKGKRGRQLAFFQLLINCGIMYAFLIGHAFAEEGSVYSYSLICAVPSLLIVLTFILPESPAYYLAKNDEAKAGKSLKRLRGEAYNTEDEIGELKRLVLASSSGKMNLKMMRNRRVLRAFVACFGVILAQQFCGIFSLIFNALMLFNNVGSGELSGTEQTLVIGAVQILSSIVAIMLVDVVGRRILLTISSALMGIFLLLLGWFFTLRSRDPEYDDFYFWMPPTWFTLYFAAFNLGVGPISWSMIGDTFPAEIKVSAAASAAGLSWLLFLIGTMSFGEIVMAMGITNIIWFFGVFCLLGAVFCAIVVKDTHRKSLIEMQEDFGIEPDDRTAR